MNPTKTWIGLMALVPAVIGGAVVWSVMTFTVVARAELAGLQEDKQDLAKCVTEKANVISTAQDAQAEVERLK